MWTEEECRNFEQGLKAYGKDFHLIQANKVSKDLCPLFTRINLVYFLSVKVSVINTIIFLFTTN